MFSLATRVVGQCDGYQSQSQRRSVAVAEQKKIPVPEVVSIKSTSKFWDIFHLVLRQDFSTTIHMKW